MGLGKTVQTLAFLLQERAAGRAEGPSLVVCPTSVVRNWHDEAARFAPDLRVLVHHGADRARGKDLRAAVADADLVLTSYPLLRSDAAALAGDRLVRVVLDEAQQIKNPDTAQARAARQLHASVRLALTGTPIENRLDELWSIVEFLNPGYLGTRSAFRARLALPIEREGDPHKTATLRRLVRPLVLRRLKSDRDVISDLPDKVVQPAWVHLSEEQASLYQSVVDESLRAVDDAEGIARKGLVLKMLTRLKQVCNHPAHALGERPPSGRVRDRGRRRGPGGLGAPQPQARAPGARCSTRRWPPATPRWCSPSTGRWATCSPRTSPPASASPCRSCTAACPPRAAPSWCAPSRPTAGRRCSCCR
jgi:SNF2 family DNA or RNA helicase